MNFDDYEKLPSNNMAIHMSAGALAGISEHIVMYPVDSVKTRMQSLAPSPEVAYRSVREGFYKMMTTEGVRRSFKGVNAVILGAGPAHALYFSAYESIKKRYGSNNSLVNHFVNAGAGCGATVVHDAIMVPADVVKQRLQMYNSPYSNCYGCARHLYRTEGLRAFYRSYTTQLAMNIPHHATLVIIYEKMQKELNPSREYKPSVHCIAGATAGAIAAAVTTPFDVCKTLLNTQETSTLNQIQKSRVTGIRNACSTIYTMQGFPGFFRGFQARILFQMPSTALAWGMYELIKHCMLNDNSSCNPEENSDLHLDGVMTEVLVPCDPIEPTPRLPMVQEKQRFPHLANPSSTVERLRTLHASSPLTATCSAAPPPDDKMLVK